MKQYTGEQFSGTFKVSITIYNRFLRGFFLSKLTSNVHVRELRKPATAVATKTSCQNRSRIQVKCFAIIPFWARCTKWTSAL